MPGWLPIPAAAIVLVIGASVFFLAVLRWLRCPGAAIIGGLAAGALLGPTFMGRISPAVHEELFIGGSSQRLARAELLARERANRLLEEEFAARVTRPEREELARATAELHAARWEHQRPLRMLGVMTACAVVLTGGICAAGRRRGRAPEAEGQAGRAVNIGLWSFTVPAAAGLFSSLLLFGCTQAESVLVAAAVGIAPLGVGAFERRMARAVEMDGPAVLRAAFGISCALGLGAALWGWWQSGGSAALGAALPVACAWACAWGLGAMLSGGRTRYGRRVRRTALHMGELCAAPLAALPMVHLELIEDFSFWPALVVLLLADDGRWLGAALGSVLTAGRGAVRTLRLLMPAMSAGPSQLIVTALSVLTGTLPARMGLSLLLGVALIELTTNVRRRVAARLAEIEPQVRRPD